MLQRLLRPGRAIQAVQGISLTSRKSSLAELLALEFWVVPAVITDELPQLLGPCRGHMVLYRHNHHLHHDYDHRDDGLRMAISTNIWHLLWNNVYHALNRQQQRSWVICATNSWYMFSVHVTLVHYPRPQDFCFEDFTFLRASSGPNTVSWSHD